jgi:tetratricopeptide (TPR) repeat protein
LYKECQPCCAACGIKKSLELAHIVALQEGGEPRTRNLIFLCGSNKKVQPGCHQLFDMGCYSVKKMFDLRKRWTNRGAGDIRKEMIKLYKRRLSIPAQGNKRDGPLKGVQELITKKYYRNAIKKLKEMLNYVNHDDKVETIIKIAETERRRATRNGLLKAIKYISDIVPEEVPEGIRSWYWYEIGYIELLTGNSERALQSFSISRDSLKKEQSAYGGKWAAATSILVQINCGLRLRHKRFSWSWNKQKKELNEALKKASKDYSYLGKRWVSNCLWHLARLELAQEHYSKAWNKWRTANNHWHKMDILSGWDAGIRPTILSLKGQICLRMAKSNKEYKKALKFLSRALTQIIGGLPQHPEGMRDLLFAIADAFEGIGESPCHTKRLRDVARKTMDGSSWLNPYYV